ncbi:glycosyltransferase family A protein [Piscinibacter sp. HJYY11]|uniref:glycosyltransferase family A protein n=1 Tax=Piscinibacter sp. HJYY11 TaxID=2801333 RepID=UPI00191DF987|nr:glycosyltransferase family 2 protein [Piscinibacter sp. HJYY11]MBL0727345.1 glycosyltransferase family 2 protein [Piscinibacter sp. HJYY11]
MQITTLIPAYKAQYLPELLQCLRSQTHKAGKIIFSDDSPGGAYRQALFSDALAPLRAGLDIECVEGPRKGGGYANMLNLLQVWNQRSELFHLLLDDDVIYPEFYERHLVAHLSSPFSCSISRRWSANEQGLPIKSDLPLPPAVARHPNRLLSLDDSVIFSTTAIEGKNWLGEFSNAVFRANTTAALMKPAFGSVSYAGLWDLGAFMAASLVAPVGYVHEHLGYFRTGPAGNSSKFFGPYMKGAYLGYAALVMGGVEIGKYTPEQARPSYAALAGMLGQYYRSQADMLPFIELLPRMAAGDELAVASFHEVWHAFLRTHDF